jgi:CheY-like chemotaxis protein
MAAKILFVDDDVNILSSFQRNLRNRFAVQIADSGEKALKILNEDSSFAVIVSDFRMPSMNGVEFLAKASAEWPDCVRVLLTGEADTRAAGAAVNQGQIFRFLSKPCPVFTLEKTLNEAVKQHELITSERVLLESTLRGSMAVLTEILNVVHPEVFSRSDRISRIAKIILRSLNVPNKWEFEIAAMLSQIGCITVPVEIMNKVWKGHTLTEQELAIYLTHPATGSRMLEKIPRLELVAQIIATQAQITAPLPAWQELEKVDRTALGSHLLKLAIDVEHCISRELNKAAIFLELRSKNHHPELLKALEGALDEIGYGQAPPQSVPSTELQCGMILDADLVGENGLLLMAKGQFLSETMVQYLQRRLQYSGSEEVIKVRRPAAGELLLSA